MVAIFKIVSAGKAVGSVVPRSNTTRPLLINDAKYISSTENVQKLVSVDNMFAAKYLLW